MMILVMIARGPTFGIATEFTTTPVSQQSLVHYILMLKRKLQGGEEVKPSYDEFATEPSTNSRKSKSYTIKEANEKM